MCAQTLKHCKIKDKFIFVVGFFLQREKKSKYLYFYTKQQRCMFSSSIGKKMYFIRLILVGTYAKTFVNFWGLTTKQKRFIINHNKKKRCSKDKN